MVPALSFTLPQERMQKPHRGSGSVTSSTTPSAAAMPSGWPTSTATVPTKSSSATVIPASAPHPELAHKFIDFTLEPEIAAEICRSMRYSSPNRAAIPLLPPEIRENPAIFPPDDVVSRLELIEDIGEATVLYDRLWTEVKTQ